MSPNKIAARGSVTLAWARRHPEAAAELTRRRPRPLARKKRGSRRESLDPDFYPDWHWRARPAPDGVKVVWRGRGSGARLGDENWSATVARAKGVFWNTPPSGYRS